jgi:SAM-dependent methyltransferase
MAPENDGGYGTRIEPIAFDFVVSWLYWPTSIGSIREALVDLLQIGEKSRVLEFGSGTGGITERMLRRGAQVTCVDRSAAMLERARRRAPEARFIDADARSFASDERFDRVLLAFFLHEQGSADRVAILKNAHALLSPGGFAVVADSAAPAAGFSRTLWRGFVRSFEPPSVLEVLDGALEHEIREAGFEIASTQQFAGGRAAAYVARPC